MIDLATTPVRAVRLGRRDAIVEPHLAGGFVMRNRARLDAAPPRFTDHLERWATTDPARVFLAERVGDGWRSVTYEEALAATRAIAGALIARGLDRERGVAILSENSIDHALLALGAMYAGVPFTPISEAYSLQSRDYVRLRAVIKALTPGLVYASDAARYARAIDAAVPMDVACVTSAGMHPHRPTMPFATLLATPADARSERAHGDVTPDSIAKILLTSGSTGMPKPVINTHRMLCANQRMIAAFLGFVEDEPPIVVDWLPWSHTFGGNQNFGLVLAHGGTLHISAGRPTVAAFGETVRNLREIAPTCYFDVPRGYDMLLTALRADRELATRFFSRTKVLFYAGAGLAHAVWTGLQEIALATVGERIAITTCLGATETGPAAIAAAWFGEEPGHIGIPLPGVEARLVPLDDRFELRLRSESIAPGYFRDIEKTARACDPDGFYRIGDTVRFIDEAHPERGLRYDGRIDDDFKLSSATWVRVRAVRERALARLAPLVHDLVLSGAGRREIVALAFPNEAFVRTIATDVAADAPLHDLVRSAIVRARCSDALAALSASGTGSASYPARLVLLGEPPSLDAGEMTDKGTLNARAILARRAELVERAHAEIAEREIIVARADLGNREATQRV